jgi:NDP-sugar pyrophosphorylase family protein
MDAMILAAGVGSRLGEITTHTPKALVRVGDVPVLERVALRLIEAGADRLIVNVHHHADQVESYIRERNGFGVETVISREAEHPLETGGGLRHASPLFRRDAPFFLHNVDVLSEIDLGRMYRHHAQNGTLATLAVNERETNRYLLFDDHGLCGRFDQRSPAAEVHAPCINPRRLAFAGVHVIAPAVLDRIEEEGAFSIIELYLRLARMGERIGYFHIRNALWLEIGTPERLEQARQHFGG